MDPHPHPQYSSNAPQQGSIRIPNAEAPPANPRPLTPAEMRQKVVEILSNTANGCLHELGYFPGMFDTLRDLELRNANWKLENTKLYEDNKRLAASVKIQNEAMKMLDAPEREKIQRISNLELENRALKVQIEQMSSSRSSEAEGSRSSTQDQKLSNLYREYMSLSESYKHAYTEVVRLREILRTGTNSYPQQEQSYQPPNLSAPNVHRIMQPQNPPQMQHASPSNQQASGSQVSQQPVYNQHGSFDEGRPGSSVQNPSRFPAQMQTQLPPQFSGPIPTFPTGYMGAQTQTGQHTRRASNPVNFINLHPQAYAQNTRPPPIDGVPVRTGSAPLPTQNSHIELPPNNPPPASAPPNTGLQGGFPSFSSVPQHCVPNPPPNETYLSQEPNTNTTTAFVSPRPANDTRYISSPLTNSNQPYGSSNAASSISNSPYPPGHLKRETPPTGRIDNSEEPNKKPRLGVPHVGPSTSTSVRSPPAIATTPNQSEMPIPPILPSPGLTSERIDEEEEEEEEDVVEVGPDGLRLVEDILEQVYGENRRREVVCWFCKNRFEKGFTETPPTVFNGATDQELEAHCVENHQVAWNQARASA